MKLGRTEILACYHEAMAKTGIDLNDVVIAGEAACVLHGIIDETVTEEFIKVYVDNDEFVYYMRRNELPWDNEGVIVHPKVMLFQDQIKRKPFMLMGVPVLAPVKIWTDMLGKGSIQRQGLIQAVKAYASTPEGNPLEDRIDEANRIIVAYGGIDGAHHKTWVIDQVFRALNGVEYAQKVDAACGQLVEEKGVDPSEWEREYTWDEGIAP